jgi:hypothetical protein
MGFLDKFLHFALIISTIASVIACATGVYFVASIYIAGDISPTYTPARDINAHTYTPTPTRTHTPAPAPTVSQVTPQITPNVSVYDTQPIYTTFETNPRYAAYNYSILDTEKDIVGFVVYGGVFEHLYGQEHTYYTHNETSDNLITKLFVDSINNYYMSEFVKIIIDRYPDNGERLRMATSLVQKMEYDDVRSECIENLCEHSTDWWYPYETLYMNRGVCSDKSVLLAYLLKELGYDVVLLKFECNGGGTGHMAVGIKTMEYDYMGSGYAYIETTMPTMITYVPTNIGVNCSAPNLSIMKISHGGLSFDVTEDYLDSVRMKELEQIANENYNLLSAEDYDDWMGIMKKYGMS